MEVPKATLRFLSRNLYDHVHYRRSEDAYLVIEVDEHGGRYESHDEEARPLVVVGDVGLVRPQGGHADLKSSFTVQAQSYTTD